MMQLSLIDSIVGCNQSINIVMVIDSIISDSGSNGICGNCCTVVIGIIVRFDVEVV
jgi:hypothetical protein